MMVGNTLRHIDRAGHGSWVVVRVHEPPGNGAASTTGEVRLPN